MRRQGPPDRAAEKTPIGCRCDACRQPGAVRLARPWPAPLPPSGPEPVSPGQWTADIRGGLGGADWDSSDFRKYPRLEHGYTEQIEILMGAGDDEAAMRLWTGAGGWAGLLRALFLTLRPEQDERPDNPEHRPWRLRWMKEKWGCLDVRTTAATGYQMGVAFIVENRSYTTCIRCGLPGEHRRADWRRPECERCWHNAGAQER